MNSPSEELVLTVSSMESEKRAADTEDPAKPDAGPAEVDPVVTRKRQEFLRRRNALYARRKYARRKIEADVLREQCLYLEEHNHHLKQEELRLRSLLERATRIVQLDGQARSSQLSGLKLSNTSIDSSSPLTSDVIESLWVQELARQQALVPSHGLFRPPYTLTVSQLVGALPSEVSLLSYLEQQLGAVPAAQLLSVAVRGLLSQSTTAPPAFLGGLASLQPPQGQMRRSLASQQST